MESCSRPRRSNGGNAGAEDEAVILSQPVGRPVRVQWMRPDDLQWSTQSAAAFPDIQIGLDSSGGIICYQADHYMPAMQDDRPVGALIAGLPTMPPPEVRADVSTGTTINNIADPARQHLESGVGPPMSEVPEIKVVILNRPEVGTYGGGSEAANAWLSRPSPRRSLTRPENTPGVYH